MEIIYCQKCHNKKRGISYESATNEIASQFNNEYRVTNGCSSYCGPGAKEHFVEINGEIISASDFPGLLKKIKAEKGEKW